MPMMRERFGKTREMSLSPSPRGRMLSWRRKAEAFRTNSLLWRAEGLATRTSAPGRLWATKTALAAETVDLPTGVSS